MPPFKHQPMVCIPAGHPKWQGRQPESKISHVGPCVLCTAYLVSLMLQIGPLNPALVHIVFFPSVQDFRVVVRIDSWETTSVYPNGHFVRVLGRIGDLEGEIATILVENSINVVPFSEAQVRLP